MDLHFVYFHTIFPIFQVKLNRLPKIYPSIAILLYLFGEYLCSSFRPVTTVYNIVIYLLQMIIHFPSVFELVLCYFDESDKKKLIFCK